MGAATTVIAQASAARGQGGSSNLQRFVAHHPPTFTEGGDLMVADHWFRQVKRIFEAMEITSDATRIRLATFRLEGESQVWWDWIKVSKDLEMMTWEEFRELFMGKFHPISARHVKAQEYLELKQGSMTVLVATPEPSPTRMASSNQNLGTLIKFFLFTVLFKFSFTKISRLKSSTRPNPIGGSKPEPSLLRRFPLSYQNVYLSYSIL